MRVSLDIISPRNVLSIDLPPSGRPASNESVIGAEVLEVGHIKGVGPNRRIYRELKFNAPSEFRVEVRRAGGPAPYLYNLEDL